MDVKFVLFIIALCVAKGVAEDGKGGEKSDLSDRVKESVKQLKAEMEEKAEKLISTTEERILLFVKEVDSAGKAVHNAVVDLGTKAEEKIEEVMKQAEENGQNIKECADKRHEENVELQSKADTALFKCMDDAENKAKNLTSDTEDLIEIWRSDIKELEETIKTCSETDDECLKLMIYHVLYLTSKIDNTLNNMMKKVHKETDDGFIKAKACFQAEEAVAVLAYRNLYKEISGCLNSSHA